MYRAMVLFVGGLALAVPHVARADDALKGFKGVRSITRTASDSQCIGNPKNPLCAVETWMGCWARQEPALCKKVWDSNDVSGTEGTWYKYRFRSAKRLTTADYGANGRKDVSQPGDIEVILDASICKGRSCQREGDMVFVTRSLDAAWKVVMLGDEGLAHD